MTADSGVVTPASSTSASSTTMSGIRRAARARARPNEGLNATTKVSR